MKPSPPVSFEDRERGVLLVIHLPLGSAVFYGVLGRADAPAREATGLVSFCGALMLCAGALSAIYL